MPKRYKILLIISFSINILIISGFALKRLYYSGRSNFLKSYDYAETRWYKKLRPLHISDTSKYDIALIGDSHIMFNNWDTVFNQHVFNAGIPGDISDGVLNRIGDVLKNKPETIYLHVGINDIINHVSIKEISINYDNIVSVIKDAGSRPVIMLVTPVATDLDNAGAINKKVGEFNELLKQKGEYISINITDSDLQFDGVHLNNEGYAKWAEVVRTVPVR